MSVRRALRERQNEAFSDFMKEELAHRNITMAECIRRMGVAPSSALRDVFNGKSRGTSKTIDRIAKVLEIEPGMLAALYRDRPKRKEPPVTALDMEVLRGPFQPLEVTSTPMTTPTSTAFALTMMPGGDMRLVLDLPGIPLDTALQIVGLLKSGGLFHKET